MEETRDKTLITLSNICDTGLEFHCCLCLDFLILQHKFDNVHIPLRNYLNHDENLRRTFLAKNWKKKIKLSLMCTKYLQGPLMKVKGAWFWGSKSFAWKMQYSESTEKIVITYCSMLWFSNLQNMFCCMIFPFLLSFPLFIVKAFATSLTLITTHHSEYYKI